MSRFWFLRKDESFWKVFIISFHSTETIHACGTQLLSQNGACVENNCQLPYYNFCLGILLLAKSTTTLVPNPVSGVPYSTFNFAARE